MTLDEAIKHCEDEAIRQKDIANGAKYLGLSHESIEHCEQCAAIHHQLAEWLMELKEQKKVTAEYKRLLKAAVEDVSVTIAEVYNGGLICECCKWKSQIGECCKWKSQIGECCCPDDGGCDVAYRWRYADEAIKLIGENTDETNT